MEKGTMEATVTAECGGVTRIRRLHVGGGSYNLAQNGLTGLQLSRM